MLIVERWLLGRMRRRTFYSLAEVNAAIGEMLKNLNEERPIRRLGVTRRQLLEEIDRPALKALPIEPYEYCEWRLRRVGIDYHVEIDAHYYSVPSLRRDKRLTARLRAAKLRQAASVEDVDYRAARGLDRALFQKLAEGQWIDAHDNLALVGPSGTGKSWFACAIGQKACRDNRSVVYHRWPRLCEELALARGDGRHPRLVKSLGRADLLILDDFGLEPLDAGARHDLLEILEERYGRRSTIVTSQLPVSAWHEVIGDPTYADAVLDRLVHNAHRIELSGESLRRARGQSSKSA